VSIAKSCCWSIIAFSSSLLSIKRFLLSINNAVSLGCSNNALLKSEIELGSLEDIFLSEQEKRKIIEENMSSLNISASS
tara:strand:- start:92 stop:328 length:237 start_codon:yes stop_codon:yes gene_type:complete